MMGKQKATVQFSSQSVDATARQSSSENDAIVIRMSIALAATLSASHPE